MDRPGRQTCEFDLHVISEALQKQFFLICAPRTQLNAINAIWDQFLGIPCNTKNWTKKRDVHPYWERSHRQTCEFDLHVFSEAFEKGFFLFCAPRTQLNAINAIWDWFLGIPCNTNNVKKKAICKQRNAIWDRFLGIPCNTKKLKKIKRETCPSKVDKSPSQKA